jgi:putative glycosyltransferase (TIGR04372 family)
MISRGMWNKFVLGLAKGDYSVLYRALVYYGLWFAGFLLAFPLILILWTLKPFFWLKIGKLHHGRIGHLALETDLFLRRRQLGIYPNGPVYWFLCDSRGTANQQLLAMFKRVMPIYESRILVSMFDGMHPIFKYTPFYQPLGLKNNEYFEFNSGSPSIYFTSDEIQKARALLKRMNIDYDKDKYVSIFARDSAFLEKTMPFNKWGISHDIRNSDIDLCLEAIKFLIEKGFTVIRLGAAVHKPIAWSHPKLIDYAVSEHRCDFLDIFFLQTCEFYIGGPSGISEVPVIADVPRLSVNYAEFGYLPFGKNCLYIPKRHRFIKTGRYLSFKEALELELDSHMRNGQELGLELEDNSSQDILEAVQEIKARVEGTFQYSPEEKKMMQDFQKQWSESDVLCRDVPTPIGIEWLKKHRDLYLPGKDYSF